MVLGGLACGGRLGGRADTSTSSAAASSTTANSPSGQLLVAGDSLRFVEHPECGTLVSLESCMANRLFREALELGYRINPVYQISLLVDHVSNGGLAKQNQSINDLGIRFGVRF